MILPGQMDRIPEALGSWLARRRAWNPVGEAVVLGIDESGDQRLFSRRVAGTIRAAARDERGRLSKALIQLDEPIDYVGHYTRRGISTVLTTAYLRWHSLSRILVTSAAVRVIDADDFEDESYDRIIALASMEIVG